MSRLAIRKDRIKGTRLKYKNSRKFRHFFRHLQVLKMNRKEREISTFG